MKNYPFVKCLKPKRIVNPYSGEEMVVSCGHCIACENHASDIRTLKCNLESLDSVYCMFVTLTYSDDFIPRMVAFQNQNGTYSFYDNTARFVKYKNRYRAHLLDSCISPSDLKLLQDKVKHPFIPYLSKFDGQLFMKRLRKNLLKYSDEKIRYYLVGELGPIHFRPHLHVLVWFNSKTTFKAFRQALYESWKFGRICCEVSRGDCAKYVAKYVNSNVYLPSIFKDNIIAPFNCHSCRLGEGPLRKAKAKVYELTYTDFISTSLPINGTIQDINMWRSLETWFFPKCRDFIHQSPNSSTYAYTCYATALNWTQETSPYRQAKYITEYLYETLFADHFVEEYKRLVDFFLSGKRFSTKKVCRSDKDVFQQIFNSIYLDLRISQHFLYNVCEFDTRRSFPPMSEIRRKIDLIFKHYSDKDMNNLLNQLLYTDDLLSSHFYEDEECHCETSSRYKVSKTYAIPYLYNNVRYDLNTFNETILPRMFLEDSYKRAQFSVKHKELNDANLIFNKI